MIELKKTYSEIISIIDNNSFYYDYEDIGIMRLITVTRNRNISYYHKFRNHPPEDPNYTGSDAENFSTSYAHYAGEWDYYNKTWKYDTVDLAAGTLNIKEIQLVNPSGDIKRAFLYQGNMSITNTVWGDNLTIQVVDIDNILGYGAGVVLKEFINVDLVGGDIILKIKPPLAQDGTPSKSKIYEGLYFRVLYNSTDDTKTHRIIINFEYEWK